MSSIYSSVTVVIPAYNSERFLAAGIGSVLRQTCAVTEIVVVDDGSIDRTADVAKSFGSRIHYIRQDNQGVSAARNAGLAVAIGTSILFLDADDCLTINAIEVLTSQLHASGDDCVVFGDSEVIDRAGNVWHSLRRPNLAGPPPSPAQAFFNWSGHPPSNFLVPTWAARHVGGFDRRFSFCADSFFLMQVGTLVPFVHVPVHVLRYLQHDANMSHDFRRSLVESVDSRLAFIEWTRDRGIDVIERPPTLLDMLHYFASRSFYTRDWRNLDETLKLAAERDVDSPELTRFRSLRRLPEWLFAAKDLIDGVRARGGRKRSATDA
jgi:glycosyltransferase involved in cell wall biosynthesis